MTPGQGGQELAENIRVAIDARGLKFSWQLLNTTTSIGAATVTRGQWVDELIQLADEALYKAKNAVRNRVV